MIDQKRLDAIRLSPRPLGQLLFSQLVLAPNFRLRPTHIVFEGAEHLPQGGGAVLVMNHTDRYNYWPFQHELYNRGYGFTATWVKGKYYESSLMGRFMDSMNNIPLPSKGYLLTKDFQQHSGRPPRDAEYAALKRYVDGCGAEDAQAAGRAGGPAVAALLATESDYRAALRRRFRAMMERVVAINQEALAMGLNLLIFPQGTRSQRLTRGHTGAAQIILHSGAPVIPVGCNGADRCYPGNLPLSRGGTIVYRIGAPLTPDGELRRFRIDEPFMPFTDDAARHHATFQALTDLLMDRINTLLDPPYQYAPDADLTQGAARFI